MDLSGADRSGSARRLASAAGRSGHRRRVQASAGGAFSMTLISDASVRTPGKSSADSDGVKGRFVDLVLDRMISQRFEFESSGPLFAGAMTMTWELEPAGTGTSSGSRPKMCLRALPPRITKPALPHRWKISRLWHGEIIAAEETSRSSGEIRQAQPRLCGGKRRFVQGADDPLGISAPSSGLLGHAPKIIISRRSIGIRHRFLGDDDEPFIGPGFHDPGAGQAVDRATYSGLSRASEQGDSGRILDIHQVEGVIDFDDPAAAARKQERRSRHHEYSLQSRTTSPSHHELAGRRRGSSLP